MFLRGGLNAAMLNTAPPILGSSLLPRTAAVRMRKASGISSRVCKASPTFNVYLGDRNMKSLKPQASKA